MGDVVVTVPKWFGLDQWIAEGDPVGAPWSGQEWHFYLGGNPPKIAPGERVYVVYNGAVRGYSPLVRVERDGTRFALVRRGGAVALSIPEYVRGFQGWRYRWWERSAEVPFPNWMDPNARPPAPELECTDCGAGGSAANGVTHGDDCHYGDLAIKVPVRPPLGGPSHG